MSNLPPFAERLSWIKPSATVAVTQKARALKAQGLDVLSFSVGEPDFYPPSHVIDAAKQAAESGASRYTAVRGIVPLREAICEDSKKRRGGVEHSIDEVVVSVGAKHTLFNLAMALYDPGDEVVIPAPYWVSYPDQVRLMGAEPVIVETSEAQGFRMTPEQLEQAITSKTKALVLCSPSNPTGAAYSADALLGLIEVIKNHSFYVIVDEIYARLVYDGFEQKSLLELAPELKERLIIVDGVSKTFAMTGWRIGWMLASAGICKACDKLQGQATTNPTAVAQFAAIAALQGDQNPIEQMRLAFEARRKIIVSGLNEIDGISCRTPEGAFYAFASVKDLLGKQVGGKTLQNDVDLADYLLDEAKCALVPGTAFGAPGFVRMSYAASNEQIEEGLSRIRAAVAKLS